MFSIEMLSLKENKTKRRGTGESKVAWSNVIFCLSQFGAALRGRHL